MARSSAGKSGRRPPARKRATKASAGGGGSGDGSLSSDWTTTSTGTGTTGGTAPRSRCTGLVVEPQQQTQWCWAAVSNSISHYYDPGSPWTQCTIVNAELGQTTCCTTGNSASCNQPWYLDLALTRVGRLQSMTAGTLPFSTLQSLTGFNNPPCARQGWAGGGGHFVAIVCCFQFRSLGPSTSSGSSGTTTNRVAISDPWYGDSVVDYSTFVAGYMGSGTWTHSYLTQS